MSAATAATCGVAIEVPSHASYPLPSAVEFTTVALVPVLPSRIRPSSRLTEIAGIALLLPLPSVPAKPPDTLL